MKRGRRYLWWIEVLIPLVFGFAISLILTSVLYGGHKRDRLASQAEKYLIEFALRGAKREATSKEKISVVSLTENDLSVFPSSTNKKYKGADISAYAEVLEKIALSKPKLIFLSWFPEAHLTSEQYLKPIIDVIARIGDNTKVFIAYPVAEIGLLPDKLREAVSILEGDDCHYEVTSYCSYDKNWSGKWIIQTIADLFWDEDEAKLPRYHISTNLPHTWPNYLVNVPRPDSLREYSFSDVRDGQVNFSGDAVFIGDRLIQRPEFAVSAQVLQRLFTIHDDATRDISEAGTPYHVFWAQLAQMFHDRQTVAVLPAWLTQCMIVIYCLTMFYLLWRYPAYWALCFLLVVSLALPFLNRLFLRHFGFYAPCFDIIYAGFLAFLYPAFGLLSVELYRRWQLAALERTLQNTEALKRNFISLISHNLNTPVARMQGLVDMLCVMPEADKLSSLLQPLREEIARLQLCVRGVLISSSLSDRTFHESNYSAQSLQDEMEALIKPLLDRLGIRIHLQLPRDEEERLIPFFVDARAYCFAVASLLALLGLERDKKVDCLLNVIIGENSDFYDLCLTIRGLDAQELSRVKRLSDSFLSSSHEAFFMHMLLRFLEVFFSAYEASISTDVPTSFSLHVPVRSS